jgi:hypothetical protein
MYTGIQGSWVNTLSHSLTRLQPQTGRSPVKETASHASPLNVPSWITYHQTLYIMNESICRIIHASNPCRPGIQIFLRVQCAAPSTWWLRTTHRCLMSHTHGLHLHLEACNSLAQLTHRSRKALEGAVLLAKHLDSRVTFA